MEEVRIICPLHSLCETVVHDGLEVVGRAIVGDHRAVHTAGEVSLGLGHSTGIASGGGLGVLCGPGGSKHIYMNPRS